MADYATACGFIQFDPVTREANGQEVVDYVIKTIGIDGRLVRVTVWPELQDNLPFKPVKGDWLAADGKLTVSKYEKDGEVRQSIQINARSLAVVEGVEPSERQVVNRGSQDSVKDLF
jgi:hypothetical protein